MSGAVVSYEHRRHRLVLARDRGGFAMQEHIADRGRRVDPDGTIERFTGAPSRPWAAAAGAPPGHDGADHVRDVQAELTALTAMQPGRLHLSYSSVAGTMVSGRDGEPASARTTVVWAVTGELTPADGPVVPLGWSGRGDGVAWLRHGARDDLRHLLDAVRRASPVSTSRGPVVLAPEAAAVLLHEAAGHAVEGDVLAGHGGDVGRRLGSEVVTLLDDPRDPDGPARYEHDDDGIRCLGPTVVVDHGVVTARLHSVSSAAASRTLPTGHGRAASAWHEPLARVANLVCEAGAKAVEELVEDAGDGLLVWRLANGASDGRRITADVVLAERVRGGRRTGELLRGGRVDEPADVLLRVVEVGANARFHTNAMCGKANQVLYDVGTCASPLRLSTLQVAA